MAYDTLCKHTLSIETGHVLFMFHTAETKPENYSYNAGTHNCRSIDYEESTSHTGWRSLQEEGPPHDN